MVIKKVHPIPHLKNRKVFHKKHIMENISRSKKFLKELRQEHTSSSNWSSKDQERYNKQLRQAKNENNIKLIRSAKSARNVFLNL